FTGSDEPRPTVPCRPAGEASACPPRGCAISHSADSQLSAFAAWVCRSPRLPDGSQFVYKRAVGLEPGGTPRVTGAICGPPAPPLPGFTHPPRHPEAALSRKALLLACAALYAAALLAGCAETPGPGLARGKMMFDNCSPCHGSEGYGNPALGAPAIAGLPRWYVERQLIDFKTSMRGADPKDMEGARMRPMARSLY